VHSSQQKELSKKSDNPRYGGEIRNNFRSAKFERKIDPSISDYVYSLSTCFEMLQGCELTKQTPGQDFPAKRRNPGQVYKLMLSDRSTAG
jgi:hypothetical protein